MILAPVALLAVAAVVAALVATSLWLVWRHDRSRLWDHVARSLVQVALAVGSVGVAFLLFDRQMQQIDRRNLRQQALFASVTVRGTVYRLVEDFETQPQLYSVAHRFDCDDPASCPPTAVESRFLEFYRESLGKPFFPKPAATYTADLRQLTQSNYALGERTMERLLRQVQAFEFGREAVGRDVEMLRREYAKLDKGPATSPALLSQLFLRLARLQRDESEVALAFVCRLQETKASIDVDREPMTGEVRPFLTYTAPGIACPPFDQAFRDIAAWNGQAMDHSALPRE